MIKKPSFSTAKEKRLIQAKHELDTENQQLSADESIRTTFVAEASLLFAIKEIALKRKKSGIKPDTVTGILKKALKEIVANENP